MGFLELKFKLLVSSKNICKGGFVAEPQTWPSLMSQLRKTSFEYFYFIFRKKLLFLNSICCLSQEIHTCFCVGDVRMT